MDVGLHLRQIAAAGDLVDDVVLDGLGEQAQRGDRRTDIGAMRAIARERLLRLALRSRTHAWPVEMLVAAARGGLRVEEVPVDARRRMGGRSKVAGSVRGSAKAGVRLLGALLRS
ncbi:MAG: hypothetical protein ACR2NH_00630 [Solirubrobacteraceae bacterium]